MSQDRALFAIPNYRKLFCATFVSSLGDGVMIVALPLIAASVSNSSRAVAWVLGFSRLSLLLLLLDGLVSSSSNRVLRATGIPWLLAKINGATLVDRSDARTIMLWADVMRFGVLVLLAASAIAGRLSLGGIYLASFLLGMFEIPFSAASQRMFPELVPDRLLPIANARISSIATSGEQFIGPAMGGLLARGSGAVPLVGDALSFLASAAFVRKLPSLPPEPRAKNLGPLDMREAWRWLRECAPLRTATLFISLLGFAQVMTLSLLIPLGRETLHLDKRGVGFFVAAIAVGNLIGTAFADRVFARLGYARNLIFVSVIIAASYLVAGLSRSVIVVVSAFVLEGIVLMFGQVAFNVLRQRLIPADLRGRVFSLTRVAVRGVTPFAAGLAGEIAERRDPSAAVFSAGLITGVGVLMFVPLLRRSFRTVE